MSATAPPPLRRRLLSPLSHTRHGGERCPRAQAPHPRLLRRSLYGTANLDCEDRSSSTRVRKLRSPHVHVSTPPFCIRCERSYACTKMGTGRSLLLCQKSVSDRQRAAGIRSTAPSAQRPAVRAQHFSATLNAAGVRRRLLSVNALCPLACRPEGMHQPLFGNVACGRL
jgi:hypothetical protein